MPHYEPITTSPSTNEQKANTIPSCVPKKVTWYAADLAQKLREAEHYGFDNIGKPTFDWARHKEKRDAYIHRLNGIYERNLGNDKVTYLRGLGKFVGKDTVEVTSEDGEKRLYKGKKILVAVGTLIHLLS